MKKQKLFVGADTSTVYTDSVRSKASTEIMHVCPKHQRNTQRGITLIALIITIIVLLILAVVSIRLVVNNGILGKAEYATQKYSEEEAAEQAKLAYAEYQMAKAAGENPTLTIKAAQSDAMLSQTANSTTYDEFGNKIVVPAGFKIKVDADTNNATHVTQGIVVTDGTNEFVWIPVGKIYTDVAKTESKAKTITLGRYVFKSDGTIDETLSQTAPEAQLKTNAGTTNYYKEGAIDGIAVDLNGNALKGYAKDINTFITRANNNGGYYLGRYEARTATARTAKEDALTTLTENKNDYVYNYVTQSQASSLSQGMYTGKPFTSDLINSYAWDTAIMFIENFSDNSSYASKRSVNESYANKGTSSDKISNIYDMASNCYEWSTETFDYSDGPCTYRGGFIHSGSCTSDRYSNSTTDSSESGSFRPILYM